MSNDIKQIFEKYKEVLKEAFEEPADPRRVFNRFVGRGNYGGSGGNRFGGGVRTGLTRKNQERPENEIIFDTEKRNAKITVSLENDYFTDLQKIKNEANPKDKNNMISLFIELDKASNTYKKGNNYNDIFDYKTYKEKKENENEENEENKHRKDSKKNFLKFENHYLVFDFELSNRIANLDEQYKLILDDPKAKEGAKYIKEKLINRMLNIPAWYFRIIESGIDIPDNSIASPTTITDITEWCAKPENKHYTQPMEVLKDGSIRVKVSNTGYHGHEGGERIQANIMPSGDSESEMEDFKRRGIEIDAPIQGHPETPYFPKRRTPEDIAPSLGSRESELEKARNEGDVVAQDRLSKNPFSSPENVGKPKKISIKPKPKKSVPATSKSAPKKKPAKKTTDKKEEPKSEKKETKKKKKPVKESYQRFIRVIPF